MFYEVFRRATPPSRRTIAEYRYLGEVARECVAPVVWQEAFALSANCVLDEQRSLDPANPFSKRLLLGFSWRKSLESRTASRLAAKAITRAVPE